MGVDWTVLCNSSLDLLNQSLLHRLQQHRSPHSEDQSNDAFAVLGSKSENRFLHAKSPEAQWGPSSSLLLEAAGMSALHPPHTKTPSQSPHPKTVPHPGESLTGPAATLQDSDWHTPMLKHSERQPGVLNPWSIGHSVFTDSLLPKQQLTSSTSHNHSA
ncbi:hypothetical protein UY3_07277 [Chelonia mydas]|uniref:Uncharacterized protein n=1 Tax=Chelonia mydas TaxID=8469 RepID=M7C4Y6_CHEMY|nr:hypothetical protein UY3_07277 [Chelonia mydas]